MRVGRMLSQVDKSVTKAFVVKSEMLKWKRLIMTEYDFHLNWLKQPDQLTFVPFSQSMTFTQACRGMERAAD